METWARLVRAAFPARPILRPLFPFLAFWPGHPQALEVATPSLLWPSGTHHPACMSVTTRGQRGGLLHLAPGPSEPVCAAAAAY